MISGPVEGSLVRASVYGLPKAGLTAERPSLSPPLPGFAHRPLTQPHPLFAPPPPSSKRNKEAKFLSSTDNLQAYAQPFGPRASVDSLAPGGPVREGERLPSFELATTTTTAGRRSGEGGRGTVGGRARARSSASASAVGGSPLVEATASAGASEGEGVRAGGEVGLHVPAPNVEGR